MDSEIDFSSDINKYARFFIKDIIINNIDISLDLTEYNNIKIIEILNQWQTCLGMMGKAKFFKTKEFMKIIYCLLSDSCKINTINGNKIDLDIYDPIIDRFLRLDVIDENNRFIKLRIFTVCNTLIVIDCKDMKNYKIYELHNLSNIKEYYGTCKVNFDDIVKLLKLQPRFIGKLSDLTNDFKILSLNNIKINKGIIIKTLEEFVYISNNMEKKIQKEYKDLYNLIKI